MVAQSFIRDGQPRFQGNDVRPVTRRGWVRVPEGFDLGKSFFAAAAINAPCIVIFPRANKNDENILGIIISPATRVTTDAHGKFKIPPEMLKDAQLEPGKSRAIFLGVGSSIEIWLKENWEEWAKNTRLDAKDLPGDFHL